MNHLLLVVNKTEWGSGWQDDEHEDRHACRVGQDLIPAALVRGVHHDAGDGGDDQQDDDEAFRSYYKALFEAYSTPVRSLVGLFIHIGHIGMGPCKLLI